MEFASREEMLAYEVAREAYYMQFLNTKNAFEFYKLWLREIFDPKYRKLKKKYDDYYGGWYRDEEGIIHSIDVGLIDLDRIENGAICVDHVDRVYVFHNNSWLRYQGDVI